MRLLYGMVTWYVKTLYFDLVPVGALPAIFQAGKCDLLQNLYFHVGAWNTVDSKSYQNDYSDLWLVLGWMVK